MLRHEEVAVLLIVGRVYLKRSQLHSAARRNTLARRFLLRHNGLQFQLSKLQIRSDSEQRTGSLHQRVVAREGDISALHQFYYLVLLALVAQFHVLSIVVEGRVGVVVQVHVHLVAHLTVHAQVYFLVEVHRRRFPVTYRQRRVVDVVERCAKLQLGRSLCLYAHSARTEYLLCRPEVEVHIGEIEFLLALFLKNLLILRAVVVCETALLAPLHILLRSHHYRCVHVGAAYLVTYYIPVERVVILHRLLHIVRALQVIRTLRQVLERQRVRPLYRPAWMEQRVGNFLLLDFHLRNHRLRLLFLLCRVGRGGNGEVGHIRSAHYFQERMCHTTPACYGENAATAQYHYYNI